MVQSFFFFFSFLEKSFNVLLNSNRDEDGKLLWQMSHGSDEMDTIALCFWTCAFQNKLMDSLRLISEADFWVPKDNFGAGKAAPVPSSLSRPYPRSVVERGRDPKHTPITSVHPLGPWSGQAGFPLAAKSHFVLPTLPPAGHTGPFLAQFSAYFKFWRWGTKITMASGPPPGGMRD